MVIIVLGSFTCKFIYMNPRFIYWNSFGINNIFFVYFYKFFFLMSPRNKYQI